MMLCEKQDIVHSGLFGGLAPLIRVATRRSEIIRIGNGPRPLFSRKGAERPADEHAELHVLDLLRSDFIGKLGRVDFWSRSTTESSYSHNQAD